VLVHHARDQFRVEAAPVDADAHRLAVAAGELDHGRELFVAFRAAPDVARVDAQLGQRLGTRRVLREQAVTVEMKIPHQRRIDAHGVEPLADRWHRGGGLGVVDSDAHDLGSGAREIRHLLYGGRDVRRIGIGHGLDHDGRIAADRDVPHAYLAARAARRRTVFWQALHSSTSRATSILVWRARSTGWSP